jgi:D-alanine-D-alanine ligase
MKKKLIVAILFGGRSAEHEVSLASARAIFQQLDRQKYDIISIYINRSGGWRQVESPLLSIEELNQSQFHPFLPWGLKTLPNTLQSDIYFPILHGPYGEDGTIQGLFELADKPYVGAAVMASAVAMDKAIAKTLFMSHELPVVQHAVIFEDSWLQNKTAILDTIAQDFPLPLFVKPSNLGSSVGITKVKDHSETEAALNLAFQYDRKILVEEGIEGREIECSVLGNEKPRASLPGEIIPHREFYDYQDKYKDGKTAFGIPAELSSEITREIQRISLEAFKVVDCSGMARVDFFIQDRSGNILLNEINTIPGFTEISMYPKLWEVSGLSFSQLLDELITLGLERHAKKRKKTALDLS